MCPLGSLDFVPLGRLWRALHFTTYTAMPYTFAMLFIETSTFTKLLPSAVKNE